MILSSLIILAALTSAIVFPFALRFAQTHNIVDNPDARKLQKVPIPVFGSVAVVSGMVLPLLLGAYFYPGIDIWYTLAAIMVLFALGVIDDIRGLSAGLRFVAEIFIIWVLIWHPFMPDNGPMIDHLHGLFNREEISTYTALPLTLVAGVGIINAINMIDGVDGYSSGFCMVANLMFAYIFYRIGNHTMYLFSMVAAAALLPFYLHNVFGKSSKMFIGDGGSLVIGLVLSNNVFTILSTQTSTESMADCPVCWVALTLAIMCIPVFDTLRVMCARTLHGGSPFVADKTHLHHLFIDMGFSHVGTSTTIILINCLIVLLWYASYLLGCSLFGQFIVVVLLGITATSGIYYGCRYAEKKQNGAWRILCKTGKWTHFEQKGVWKTLEHIIDWNPLTKNK